MNDEVDEIFEYSHAFAVRLPCCDRQRFPVSLCVSGWFGRYSIYFHQDGILARLSKEDLAFYDGVAQRIRGVLDDSRSVRSIASLAKDVRWNRTSLSNFLSRKNQTIPTHLLVRVAKTLNVPAGYLMTGE
jgi:hypothetical protein